MAEIVQFELILKLRKNNRPALSGILYKSRFMKIFLVVMERRRDALLTRLR